MLIARSTSAPVRARPLTVAARVGALWDEAVAALEGTGAGDTEGTAGDGAALGRWKGRRTARRSASVPDRPRRAA